MTWEQEVSGLPPCEGEEEDNSPLSSPAWTPPRRPLVEVRVLHSFLSFVALFASSMWIQTLFIFIVLAELIWTERLSEPRSPRHGKEVDACPEESAESL